ncbi:MAG TPA: M14 family zinc carboxypeptidase [Egibacteraceae bacterium]|nr:M14 family zinc carboxypeptidase [Egibacteraceae bacterium]
MGQSGRRVSRRALLRGAGITLGAVALGGPVGARGLVGGVSGAVGGATGVSHAVAAGDVLRLARVWPGGLEGAALLAGFDDTHRMFDDGSVEVLLWPGDLERLVASGLRFDVTVEDVIARDVGALQATDAQVGAPTGRLPGQRDTYRTLRDYEDDLLGLVTRFPLQARLIVLPERTLEGRRVVGIEIADDVHLRDGRPVWYMDGLHHAREWPAGELTLMFGFELLENPQGDERVTALRRDTRTILVPVVNPDGFSWSRDALVQTSDPTVSLPFAALGLEAYWRKNRRGVLDEAVIDRFERNLTSYGVDPNRNYSVRWGGPGASPVPVDQTHRGAGPFSEPEVRNVAGLLRERQPVTLNSNHTYTGLVLRPWGHAGGGLQYSPDEPLLRDLGAAMCAHNGYNNWHGIELYATTGTTSDWAYAALGSLSYTYEIGFTNFHPPYGGEDGPLHHYRLNRESFLLLGEAARLTAVELTDPRGAPVLHATHGIVSGRVVDGGGNPVAADLAVARTARVPLGDGTLYPEPSRATMATPADGAFAWHLPPSTTPMARERGEEEAWTLTVAAGGRSVTRQVRLDRGQTADLGEIRLT